MSAAIKILIPRRNNGITRRPAKAPMSAPPNVRVPAFGGVMRRMVGRASRRSSQVENLPSSRVAIAAICSKTVRWIALRLSSPSASAKP
jgi:hypothetical protein